MEFMRVPFRSSRTSAFGPVAGLLVETTRVRELRVVGHDAIGEAFGDRAEQSATTADEDDGRQGRCRTKPALDLARNLALGLLYGRTDRTGEDRKSVESGKSVSVRVNLGGRRILKKKKKNK